VGGGTRRTQLSTPRAFAYKNLFRFEPKTDTILLGLNRYYNKMKILGIIETIAKKRAELVVTRVLPYIKYAKKIIDIGCGTGHVTHLLTKHGKKITPVDISNKNWISAIKPIIYDGKRLPFPDQSFDTSLLLMVLHHTPDPKVVFLEAARVGKEVIVIETVYKYLFDKIVTVLFDSLGNLQPRFYWNSYRRDEDWKTFFKSVGYKVEAIQCHRDWWFLIPYLHNVYYLKKVNKS